MSIIVKLKRINWNRFEPEKSPGMINLYVDIAVSRRNGAKCVVVRRDEEIYGAKMQCQIIKRGAATPRRRRLMAKKKRGENVFARNFV